VATLASVPANQLLKNNGRESGAADELHSPSEAPMKKPTIHVAKWLKDIPVEAKCSACPDVSFRAQGSSHRPNRDEYQGSLQSQFDAHCKAEHEQDENSEERELS
jgi:hypothetical protein